MLNRFVCIAAAFVLAATAVSAAAQDGEEEKLEVGQWHNSVDLGLGLNQSAYSDNWRGGGTNSLSWVAHLRASAQKRHDNGVNWANRLILRFGQTHQQERNDDGSRTWNRPTKTEDKIDFESLALLEKDWKVDPYLSARWESQFIDESDIHGREVPFNPHTIRESAGVAKLLLEREKEYFLTRFGWTQRQSFRKQFNDNVTTATTGVWSHDGGLELQADWNILIAEKKLSWLAKFSIYQPLAWSESGTFDAVSADSLAAGGLPTDIKNLTTGVDVRWENTFATRVTKWLEFNLYVEVRYDKYDNSVVPTLTPAGDNIANIDEVRTAVTEDVQWRQSIGVGFTYSFL